MTEKELEELESYARKDELDIVETTKDQILWLIAEVRRLRAENACAKHEYVWDGKGMMQCRFCPARRRDCYCPVGPNGVPQHYENCHSRGR